MSRCHDRSYIPANSRPTARRQPQPEARHGKMILLARPDSAACDWARDGVHTYTGLRFQCPWLSRKREIVHAPEGVGQND